MPYLPINVIGRRLQLMNCQIIFFVDFWNDNYLTRRLKEVVGEYEIVIAITRSMILTRKKILRQFITLLLVTVLSAIYLLSFSCHLQFAN
jgi:hypothetical protein